MHSVIDHKVLLLKKKAYFLPKILGKCMKLLILKSDRERGIYIILKGNFLLARVH